MGRYYDGNISGKFWFGVQPSNDGEFFGMIEYTDTISYMSEDLEQAEEGVKKCKEKLDGYLEHLDAFFDKNNGYNDPTIIEHFKDLNIEVDNVKVRHLLEWYARLGLGRQIVKAIKEEGECYYDAEI
jgi:hypothetical protein